MVHALKPGAPTRLLLLARKLCHLDACRPSRTHQESRVTVQAEQLGRNMTLRNFTYTAQTMTQLRYREVAHSQHYKHASCRNFGRIGKQKYGLGNYGSIPFYQACQGEQCRECATYADFIIAAKPVRPGIERTEILT